MMTYQEIYDKVKQHLLTQNAKAVDPSRVAEAPAGSMFCCYRSPDGKMCAAGCLIKDEFYSPDLEGKAVTYHMVASALRYSGVISPTFVVELQYIHDHEDEATWGQKLSEFAKIYGLNP